MKFGRFTPTPGDLFTWHYDFNDEKLPDSYNIWLPMQGIYIPSSGTNILISLTKTDIWWINSSRFIHTRVDETLVARGGDRALDYFIHARVDETHSPEDAKATLYHFNYARVNETGNKVDYFFARPFHLRK